MRGIPFEAVAKVLLWLAVIAALLAGVAYIMRRLRDSGGEDAGRSGDLMTSFREIHEAGQLSDEEFRSIKSRLAERMQDELKRDEDAS
jgi:hypothetical protein